MNIDEYYNCILQEHTKTPAVTLADSIRFHTVKNQERSELDPK